VSVQLCSAAVVFLLFFDTWPCAAYEWECVDYFAPYGTPYTAGACATCPPTGRRVVECMDISGVPQVGGWVGGWVGERLACGVGVVG
jgi:hypothetical protein